MTEAGRADGANPAAAGSVQGGFLLLDKPRGISSFQALYPLKRLFRGLKVGHAGTLDPAASGLLLVGIGHATRLLEYLEGMPKTYSFLARFGLRSDTYDMEGAVTGDPALSLERDAVEAALPAYRGPIRQTPPAYSAVKVDGERAYDLARAGEAVVLEARSVEVHALDLLGFESGVGTFRMECSKGTYVRSLARDLGEALGCGAVADRIRRLAIGPYSVENAVALTVGPDGRGTVPAATALLPLDTAVAHLPTAILPAHRVAALRDGKSTAPGQFTWRTAPPAAQLAAPGIDPGAAAPEASAPAPSSDIRVLDPEGRLLAIATLNSEGQLCPKKVLARN